MFTIDIKILIEYDGCEDKFETIWKVRNGPLKVLAMAFGFGMMAAFMALVPEHGEEEEGAEGIENNNLTTTLFSSALLSTTTISTTVQN